MSLFDLQGRTALVTGATQGLGLAIARTLAEQGARVVVSDRDALACEQVAASLPNAIGVAADMALPSAIAALVERAGPLDILVCNAGIQGPAGPLADASDADWQGYGAAQLGIDAEQLRGKGVSSLSIGLGPTPTATLLHLVVPDFHKRFPDVRLNLISGVFEHLESALQQGKIELAITAVPPKGLASNLACVELFSSNLTVVAREGHPLAGVASLAELRHTEWVLLGSPGGPGGTVARYFTDHGFAAPPVAATCEAITQMVALVRSTDWMCMIPAVLIEKDLMGRGLVTLKLREAMPQYVNTVLHRREPQLSSAAQAFLAMSQSCARVLSRGSRRL